MSPLYAYFLNEKNVITKNRLYRFTDPVEPLYRLFLPKLDFSVGRVGNRTLMQSPSRNLVQGSRVQGTLCPLMFTRSGIYLTVLWHATCREIPWLWIICFVFGVWNLNKRPSEWTFVFVEIIEILKQCSLFIHYQEIWKLCRLFRHLLASIALDKIDWIHFH